MISSERRKKFWPFSSAVTVLALLLISNALVGCSRSEKKLQHFDGVLSERQGARDPALSALYVRAGNALNAGNAAEAEATYREIAAKYPKDPDSFSALGACLYFEKKYADSKSAYLHALELDPRSSKAFYGLGSIAFDQEHMEESKTNLVNALRYNENDAFSHRLLGFIYENSGDAPKAIAHLQRAIALDSSLANDPGIKESLQSLKATAPSALQRRPTSTN